MMTCCQQVAANLSISSSCIMSVKLSFVATSYQQTCYNLLKQWTIPLLFDKRLNLENQIAQLEKDPKFHTIVKFGCKHCKI